jgi:hypothetical protein
MITSRDSAGACSSGRSASRFRIELLRPLILVAAVLLAVIAGLGVARAQDEKKEKQSGFATSDGKVISSSAFVKMLKEKLGPHYQDLEIIVDSCFSGEFVDRCKDATKGLGGNWSCSTASDATHPANEGGTTGDVDIPDHGNPGLHQGDRYYYGYAAQYAKKLKDAPNTSNKDLHAAARDKNDHPEQEPRYDSSGATANDMTVHGGTTSNHAIVFSQPTDFGEAITQAVFDGLKGAGYGNADINYLRDTDSGTGDVDGNATEQGLKDALDAMSTQLQEHPGEEKAYVFIDAHGTYQELTVAYLPGHTPGIPGDGRLITYPTATVGVEIDSTLFALWKEEVPRTGGGTWADEPTLHRRMQPFLRFTTAMENGGPSSVSIYADNVPVGGMLLTGNPLGASYKVPLSDPVLDLLFPMLQSDSILAVRFDFDSPAASIALATDDDFYLDPSFPSSDYGVGGVAVIDASETHEPNTAVGSRSPEGLPSEIDAWPNPFEGSVRLTLRLPQETPAALEIFDVRGRRIRRILVAPANGLVTLVWDGRSDDGRVSAPGIYMVHVTGSDFEASARVLLLR